MEERKLEFSITLEDLDSSEFLGVEWSYPPFKEVGLAETVRRFMPANDEEYQCLRARVWLHNISISQI